jgi:hypothetical protein
MKVLAVMICTVLFNINLIYPVSTKYINDFKFDNIDLFEFSNISFLENGGLELSRDYKTIYTSSHMLWTLENWDNGFLVSGGESAALSFVKGGNEKEVFSSSNHLLFSDVEKIGDRIYLTAVPEGTLFILDKQFHLSQKIELSNQYLWDIVPAARGFSFWPAIRPQSTILITIINWNGRQKCRQKITC